MILHSDLNFRAKLRAAIEDYAEALTADSWKGGGDPADILCIEEELRDAKAKLDELVNQAAKGKP